MAYFSLWFLYGTTLWLLSFISKRMSSVPNPFFPKEIEFSFFEAIWRFSLVELQYGSAKTPKSPSANLLQMAWCVFTIITIAFYTANLVSCFSQGLGSQPLESIHDILESDRNLFASVQRKNEIVGTGNTILDDLMVNNRIQFLPLTVKNNTDIIEIKQRMTVGQIWLDWESMIDALSESIPSLYKPHGYFSQSSFGFVLRADCPVSAQVKDLFIGFGRSGYFDEVAHKYTKKKERVFAEKFTPIKIDDLYPVVLLMIAIVVISMIMIVFTHIFDTLKTQKFPTAVVQKVATIVDNSALQDDKNQES